MPAKPIITLKNIKYLASLSEETHCFSAVVYVDGEKFATVQNSGQGGCDDVHPFNGTREAVRELDARIKATYPKLVCDLFPDGLERDLESICSELVDEFLLRQDFKKVMRRVTYTQADTKGLFQLPAKYKPDAATLARIKARAPWAKTATFLAELPEAQALEIYRNNT